MSKLFVRERANVAEGEGRPRFEIVAVSGVDLQVFHSHVRKVEVEALAAEIGATIVYLPRGTGASEQPRKAAHKSAAKRAAKSSGRRRAAA